MYDNLLALYNLSKHVGGERSHSILQQIFREEQLRKEMKIVYILHGLANPEGAPDAVIQYVKNAVASIKARSFQYKQSIRLERTKIARVKDLQQRGVGLLGAAG